MDSLTQIALGAAVGEATLGRKIGNKAIYWGAILGTLPDLDVLVPMGEAVASFTGHRSWSHSLIILTLASPFIAKAIAKSKWHGGQDWVSWFSLVWLVLTTHALLDAMTIYGTQLLWPLTTYPFGNGSVFIVDPFYTIPVLIGVIAALVMSRERDKGHRWNTIGLLAGVMYLAWGVSAQARSEYMISRSLVNQGYKIESKNILSLATPLNTFLWRAVVVLPDGYLEGYYSLFDGNRQVKFKKYTSQNDLKKQFDDHWPVSKLMQFTKGFNAITNHQDKVVMSDLRMGMEGAYVFRFIIAQNRFGQSVPVRSVRFRTPRQMGRFKKVWVRIFSPDVDLSPTPRSFPRRKKRPEEKLKKERNELIY